MKKALALVLALVLALSMAVSAFATVNGLGLVVLGPGAGAPSDKIPVPVVPAVDFQSVLYAPDKGVYYIALDDQDYENVTLTANGDITAELVDYDPTKMDVTGLKIEWDVTEKGVVVATFEDYDLAVADAAARNEAAKVTYYGVSLKTNVNIIKITVAPNYTAAYRTSTLVIKATLDKVPVSATLTLVTDVTIFEYEMVKWTAENTGKVATAYLDLADASLGYSDYLTAIGGYGAGYDTTALRNQVEASVVSTTAFRAIAGKDLVLKDGTCTVVINDVAAGQKGVNFKHEEYAVLADGSKVELTTGLRGVESINLDFLGNQVVASEYTVTLATGYNWYTLREAFGVKVEEDDIITYYLLKDGKVVKEYVVDYMTADYTEAVVLSYTGSNAALGSYELVLDVPAVEGGEENPNTGAESVVGVVAALAVVSLATAAAVSLKK